MAKIITRKTNIRLKDYSYFENGYYFVTICSKNRENIFGEIHKKFVGTGLAPVRNKIKVSKLGQIINNQWNDIPNKYEDIELDKYIIMPNHLHGILILNKRTGASPVPTISKIIGVFKSKASLEYLRFIKNRNLNFSGKIWQRSFYDHIIRNERSLDALREYISNNPVNWEQDIEKLISA